jgi:hypothetical protein
MRTDGFTCHASPIPVKDENLVAARYAVETSGLDAQEKVGRFKP